MERNTNNEITFPSVTARLRSIGRALNHFVCFFPSEAPDYMSSHHRREAPPVAPIEPEASQGSLFEKYCVLGIIPTSEWKEE